MFCDACGVTLQPGQQFCTRCGKQVVGPVTAGSGRVAQHVHLLGVLWIAYSALIVIMAVVVFAVGNLVFAHFGQMGMPGPPPPIFLRPLLSFIGILMLGKGAIGLAAGIGLLQRQPWARTLAIVVGILSLFNIPFGLAMGIYTLWVLLSPNAEKEYEALAAGA